MYRDPFSRRRDDEDTMCTTAEERLVTFAQPLNGNRPVFARWHYLSRAALLTAVGIELPPHVAHCKRPGVFSYIVVSIGTPAPLKQDKVVYEVTRNHSSVRLPKVQASNTRCLLNGFRI